MRECRAVSVSSVDVAYASSCSGPPTKKFSTVSPCALSHMNVGRLHFAATHHGFSCDPRFVYPFLCPQLSLQTRGLLVDSIVNTHLGIGLNTVGFRNRPLPCFS